MIQQLLNIKSIREYRAYQAVSKQQRLLSRANHIKKQLQSELSAYHSWRIEEEKQVFIQAKNNPMTKKELDKLQQHIGLLREKQATLEQRCATQEHNCQQQRQLLLQLKTKHMQTQKALEKYKHLHRQEQAGVLAMQEYKEEQEREECALIATQQRA